MVIDEVRNSLDDDSVVFDSPSFDNSIIGKTFDGRPIYLYEKMVHEFMEDNKCKEADALDFIDYNTMRAVPYIDSPKKPMIVYCEMEFEEE